MRQMVPLQGFAAEIVKAYAQKENLALSILKNQTTDPQKKRHLRVCYPSGPKSTQAVQVSPFHFANVLR